MIADPLLVALGLCAAGLLVMIVGAELLVRGGSALAARLNIPPVVVGLTVVALGTSAPELAVGIDAALQGNGPLAIGNIAGTNTVNLLLIFGFSAAIRPLQLQLATLRLDLPAMLVASVAMFVMCLDGSLSFVDGLLLLAIGIAYSGLLVRSALQESRAMRMRYTEEYGVEKAGPSVDTMMVREAAMLIGGIIIIVLGADWLVDGGVSLARIWGVSDAFIGLTIVAIGTSAPELVTTIVSTIKNERDIAIGNLLGSSTYNIAFILGITSLVPAGGIPVSPELLFIDIPVMIAAVLACVPVFLLDKRVSRLEGSLFVAAYAVYLGYLLIART